MIISILTLKDVSTLGNISIKKSITHFFNLCSKNFREATTSDSDYVQVLAGSGCWSYVGKLGGKQKLNLQPNGCMS